MASYTQHSSQYARLDTSRPARGVVIARLCCVLLGGPRAPQQIRHDWARPPLRSRVQCCPDAHTVVCVVTPSCEQCPPPLSEHRPCGHDRASRVCCVHACVAFAHVRCGVHVRTCPCAGRVPTGRARRQWQATRRHNYARGLAPAATTDACIRSRRTGLSQACAAPAGLPTEAAAASRRRPR